MTILATRSLVDQAECGFHLIACTSNTLKRVCRSTLTAETYQMELGVEAADQLRATSVDMFVPLSRKQWEIEATSAIHVFSIPSSRNDPESSHLSPSPHLTPRGWCSTVVVGFVPSDDGCFCARRMTARQAFVPACRTHIVGFACYFGRACVQISGLEFQHFGCGCGFFFLQLSVVATCACRTPSRSRAIRFVAQRV